MMKSLLLILFLAPTFTFAQNYKDNRAKHYLNRLQYFGTEIDLNDFNSIGTDMNWSELKENGVRSLTIERGKSTDKTHKVRYLFNDQGMIKAIEYPKDTIHYSYVHDSLIKTIERSGRETKLSTYEYKDGLLEKKEVFENDRLSSRVLMDYTTDQKVAFSLWQSGRKLRKSYSMSYEYENGKIRRQQFIRNDQVIRSWDYSCEPKGRDVKEKGTSILCKVVEENNDGSYVNHVRKVEDGQVLLYAHYFTKDSLNYASTCEKETGEKVWSTELEGNKRTSINFDNSGKIRSKTVWLLGEDDRLLEVTHTFGRKQKRESKTKYTYNADGLLASKTSFYKGKESYYREYIYN